MEINKTFRAKWQSVSECMFLKVTQIIIGKVQLKQSIESILNLLKLKKGKTDNDVLFRMLGAIVWQVPLIDAIFILRNLPGIKRSNYSDLKCQFIILIKGCHRPCTHSKN